MQSLESSFHMVDISAKTPSSRRAQAQGRIELTGASFDALVGKANPKGDVLALAETAGIIAAKNTAHLLPLCHPLTVEQVRISFRLEPETLSVWAICDVAVTGKTGVEMEALSGVSAALLCVYDLCKAVDPVLKISDLRLNSKCGGKSGLWWHPEHHEEDTEPEIKKPLSGVRLSLLTISDSAAEGRAEDRSGPLLRASCQESGATVLHQELIADDQGAIETTMRRLALETDSDVIISTGGTGLGPRDVTPEALNSICERMIPGIGEALRAEGIKHNPMASLSRSTAGTIGSKLIIALPGSPKAVQESMSLLPDLIHHALHTLKGGGHHALR